MASNAPAAVANGPHFASLPLPHTPRSQSGTRLSEDAKGKQQNQIFIKLDKALRFTKTAANVFNELAQS